MRILFITGNYPSAAFPANGAFVRQLVWAVARQGHDCSVISPVRQLLRRFGPLPPLVSQESAGAGVGVQVLRPRYHSAGSKKIGFIHTGRFTQFAFEHAVIKSLSDLGNRPDVCYGHFLYPGGSGAAVAARHFGVPAFAAVGEGTFWTIEPFGAPRAQRHLAPVSGFVAVSSVISGMLREQLQIPDEKIGVFPNGVDLCRFHPRPREEMCRKHGLCPDAFHISFVGNFDELKGVARLAEAVRNLKGVRLILIGKGPVKVASPVIVFKGPVAHEVVPELLCASDLFVLPTAEEGSCNAVIEAMACGLPVVTSNGNYMDDLVNDQVALRVNPLDVAEIRRGILTLMNEPARRHALAARALEHSRKYDINLRAKKILNWIQQRMDYPSPIVSSHASQAH